MRFFFGFIVSVFAELENIFIASGEFEDGQDSTVF